MNSTAPQPERIYSPKSPVILRTVTADEAGQRIDNFLMRYFKSVPRSRVYRLVRKGEVRVNRKRVDAEYRIQEGDEVRLPPVRIDAGDEVGHDGPGHDGPGHDGPGHDGPRHDGPGRAGLGRGGPRLPSSSLIELIERAVIFQDKHLLVIDKPAGVAVHGGSGMSFGVIEALRASRPRETLELVHRLDRDTSGCLLVARERSTLTTLHALIRNGGMHKTYLGLVAGSWQLGTKRIDAPLATDNRQHGERHVRVAPAGKESVSVFKPVQFFGALATLMEVDIPTGRTHQIRVHASFAGHPLLGDDKYGDRERNAELRRHGLKRTFLHAQSVAFEWPGSGVPFHASAPLPAELAAVIDAITPVKRRNPQGKASGRASAKRPARRPSRN
ncbi:MAG TPA: RluA family pseudouridine synthase [Steroidobacteraceae bacterium]|nr:RluA family pseudouridine synthase [Steroidobacteraceae bacterium]